MNLALGTVQFGMDYGVTNPAGTTPINEVERILNIAKENNINTIDVSPAYGNSEQILGDIGVDDWQIITKTTSLKNGVDAVIKNFHQSLKNLKQTKVDGLLIHDMSDVKNKQFDSLFKKLHELKEEGLIKRIGFSTYTPEQVDFLLENFDFNLIQVPLNVFDNRLIEGRQLKKLKNKGIEIHARSVFLQGILLGFNHLNDYFLTWKNQFLNYQQQVEESGSSLLEYALNFALNTEELDKVLVGVNSMHQLSDIIKASQKNRVVKAFEINDIDLLNPSLWQV